MSSKCTAAKAYDILGIYDFPDNFDALNGLHSYLYTNSDMVVEALASQKYKAPARAFRASGRAHGFRPGRYDGCRPCRCGRGRASPHRSVETGRERRKRRTMRSRHHRLQRLRETGKLFSSQDAADAAASPLSGHRKRPGTRCASQTSIVCGQHRKSRP